MRREDWCRFVNEGLAEVELRLGPVLVREAWRNGGEEERCSVLKELGERDARTKQAERDGAAGSSERSSTKEKETEERRKGWGEKDARSVGPQAVLGPLD